MQIVKQRIETFYPGIHIELVKSTSKGDALQDVPLHTVEGSDFFTREIYEMLLKGEADIAVHSLKDLSSEHFFGENKFAVVDRDDTRDVVLFHPGVEQKIKNGQILTVGTCSPRREQMVTLFLKKALPRWNNEINIETKPIRGNVETRLQKLDKGDYDATILATAGLNRLLRSEADAPLIKKLLEGKRMMLLPLIECAPAPCQGAIIAEAHPANARAVELLKKINDGDLMSDCRNEKMEAVKYGTGCLQRFGVTTIKTVNSKYQYAAGTDAEGTDFVKWSPLPVLELKDKNLFSTTERMKDFFRYEWVETKIEIRTPVVFVANYKALSDISNNINNILESKTILASGTKTWYELAKQGYWVTACADAMGFEFLLSSMEMPLLNINPGQLTIITHDAALARWQQKGFCAISTYRLHPVYDKDIEQKLASADIVFWSSYAQYEFYGKFVKANAKHVCAGGETARLLQQHGLEPVVFPTIKSFEQWRKTFIPSRSVA